MSGEFQRPFGLTGIEFVEFIRVHGHIQQPIFDAEYAVEGFEEAGRLHVAEAAALLVKGNCVGDILIGFAQVGRIEEGLIDQQVRREFLVFFPHFAQKFFIIG